MHSSIYTGTSSMVRVEGLATRAGTPITNATVTATTLTDRRGRAVFGFDPVTLAHVGDGTYEGEIPAVAVTPNRIYMLTIEAESGALDGQWTETLIAQQRRA